MSTPSIRRGTHQERRPRSFIASKLSKRTKKISTAVAVVAIVGAGAGAAYAYWTSSGTGDGTGTTGTSTGFTVTEGAITGDALTPGGPSQSVAFIVANPSTGNQRLSSVVVTVVNSDGSAFSTGAAPACTAADYTVGTPAITYGVIAPAGTPPAGTLSGSVTVTMNNLGTNQDSCKNVPYPLHFVAS